MSVRGWVVISAIVMCIVAWLQLVHGAEYAIAFYSERGA